MKLTGILGALEFRNRILHARDLLKAAHATTAPAGDSQLLGVIHEDLQQILKELRSRGNA